MTQTEETTRTRGIIDFMPQEIDDFELQLKRFQAGEFDETDFQAFRLKQGVYGQRQLDAERVAAALHGQHDRLGARLSHEVPGVTEVCGQDRGRVALGQGRCDVHQVEACGEVGPVPEYETDPKGGVVREIRVGSGNGLDDLDVPRVALLGSANPDS